MLNFVRNICVDTLQDCLLMKKSNKQSIPQVKQSIQPQDDERSKMANVIDQDDNLENDGDDSEFSTEWTTAPSSHSMILAYEPLQEQQVIPKNEKKKSANQIANKEVKQDLEVKKKAQKMIVKSKQNNQIEQTQNNTITKKQQDLIDEEPNYFEEIGVQQEQQLTFNEAQVVNKSIKKEENTKEQKSRFNDDVLEDFNANGWVDDIEIEL